MNAWSVGQVAIDSEDASGVHEMTPKSSLQWGDKPQFTIISVYTEGLYHPC